MEPFATRLALARFARKMSMKELADKAGLTSSSVSCYEEGRKTPSLANAIKLSGALDCPYDWLFGKPEELDEKGVRTIKLSGALDCLYDWLFDKPEELDEKGVRTREQPKMPWEEEK